MTHVIAIIDEIARFGLEPNVAIDNKELHLERNLVQLYCSYFEVAYVADESDYPDIDLSLPSLRENIESNFPGFGFYDVVLDINKIGLPKNIGTADAVDDLYDIIKDMLEVKWRLQNNSAANGLWFFRFIMNAHTKAHILGLLTFLHQRQF